EGAALAADRRAPGGDLEPGDRPAPPAALVAGHPARRERHARGLDLRRDVPARPHGARRLLRGDHRAALAGPLAPGSRRHAVRAPLRVGDLRAALRARRGRAGDQRDDRGRPGAARVGALRRLPAARRRQAPALHGAREPRRPRGGAQAV
ncbi:MAG: hypothetical protein AVDCRST_MAG30-2202, partial [uncultured Solirubrobacteraceae bacterium]